MRDHERHTKFVGWGRLLGLGLMAAVAACGAQGGDPPDVIDADGGIGTGGAGGGGGSGLPDPLGGLPNLEKLRLDPPTAEVTIVDGKAATQMFRAMATFKGSSAEQDVSDKVFWQTDFPARAAVTKGLATTGTTVAGHVKITAVSGRQEASADLLVKLSLTVADPVYAAPTAPLPLPADPATKFGGTMDATRAPQLVYPNDGVLLPPNLFGIEVHFRPGMATNTLFELAFKSDVLDLKVYTRCTTLGTGCVYEPSPDVWKFLAQSSRGSGPVTVTVRGTDDQGTAFGASASIKMTFSFDEIAGGIYYWTTSGKTGIMRWDFGDRAAKMPELILAGEQFTEDCVGCHALSRDGTKMVVSNGGQSDGRLLLYGVAQKSPMQPWALPQRSQFETWSPDGKAFVGVFGDTIKYGRRPGEMEAVKDLLLFDGMTGAFLNTISAGGGQADHPDWSPDGKRIAFTVVGDHTTDQKSHGGGISSITLSGATWSAPEVHIPSGAMDKNRYYPAISPDNSFFVFNESTCPAGSPKHADCDMDMDPTATLFGLPFAAAAQPVELKNANAPGVADEGKTALTNSYPKWSPFVFTLSETRKLMWLTFTSRRSYGLRGNANGARSLIWMVGIEPSALHSGQDPSFTAFALPFQDLETNNHIAQWTERIVNPE